MADRYSTFYAATTSRAFTAGVEAASTTYSPAGSTAEKVGDAHRVIATYTAGAAVPLSVLFSTTDRLFVCKLPPRAKVQRIHISQSADACSAQTQSSIGYTGAPTAYASAQDLDAGTDDTIDIGALDQVAVPSDWVDLIIAPNEGGLNQAATLTFVVDYTIQKA